MHRYPGFVLLHLRSVVSGRCHGRIFRFASAGIACLTIALAGSSASAQDEERAWSLGVALGYGERSNPLIGGETIDIHAVVDFSWYGERFFFDNGDFGFTLHDQNNYSFNLIATFNNERHYYSYLTGQTFGLETLLDDRMGIAGGPETADASKNAKAKSTNTAAIPDGYDAVSLNQHTELPDRNFAFNGGLEFLYVSPWGDVQAQILSDVSSTHDGQEAWLSWSRPWYTRNNQFTLTLGMEWKSANLVSYYYGVREDEDFPGRPFYEAGSGTNGFIRLAARHAFSQHWYLVAMVEREFLSSAISNSPIVEETEVDTFFAGLFYQF